MTRIEEIRNELRGEIDRVEHIMDGSGIQPWVNYSTGALTELLSHIDALTAQLTAKYAEVERLRVALQEIAVAELKLGLYHGGETYCGMNQRIKRIAEAALAATSRGEGGINATG